MSQIAVNAFRAALPDQPRVIPLADSEIAKALKAAFATMYGVRRPVAMIRQDGDPLVLCDDGTLWDHSDDNGWAGIWYPPVPGTIAAGGGVVSPLHTKLGQIREALDLPGATTEWFVAEVRKILDTP